MSPRLFLACVGFLLVTSSICSAQERSPDLTLRGTIAAINRETYVEVPFKVPAGVVRVSVAFAYTEHEHQTTIDLGLFDGERFRGWSGGNKSSFTVAETDATPSYLAGPIRPGVWKLILGVPSVGAGIRSQYEAKIFFTHPGEKAAVSTFEAEPVREGPAWYRGDLHMHDAHSDGSCMSQSGKKVPCPLYKTVEAAVARGLDFIAITDHNTVSHFDAERELAPYFDKMLFIPGREITTFDGHANVYGTTEFIDFRLTSKYVPTFSDLLDEVDRKHGILSINHPGLPTGSACMGCGWSVKNTDFSRVHVIEAVNGDNVDNNVSGIPFWQQRLNDGLRVTAIGGSDNHNATLLPEHESAIGRPTTVVYAKNLSERAVLDGVLAGHVFIDVQGSHDRSMSLTANTHSQTAMMGDALNVPSGESIHLVLTLDHVEGAHAELVRDGAVTPFANGQTARAQHVVLEQDEPSDGRRHWLRMSVRDAEGKLLLLGNPVYVNFPVSGR
ncbi:MAG: CehA/McbA family metallohydrolase [Edaphobacter sp.]|uniref:CehA/McbA family metallohydrolase n=1 Tax=Edaphobacter sp. TaxID=1934404 RepID=UPI0023A0AB79|nr:CehA/McbA family metallohydrolase [Edaphobacter sp.]MDE1177812.1 CehA/McbA family metallohydrolase [Edaphobacter sp.]